MAQWIKPDINIDFVGQRRKYWMLSSIVVLIGVGALFFNVFTRGSALNYGTDFRGGSQIQIEFSKKVTTEDIRKALKNAKYKHPEVVKLEGGNPNSFMLRLVEVTSFSKAEQAKAKSAIDAAFAGKLARIEYKDGGDKAYFVFNKSLKFDVVAEQTLIANARAEARKRERQALLGKSADKAEKEEKTADKKDATSQPTSLAASQPEASDSAASQPTSLAASQPASSQSTAKTIAFSQQIKAVLEKAGFEIQLSQLFGRPDDRVFEVTLGGLGGDIEKAFEVTLGKGIVKDIPQVETVGAKMGRQLRNDGIKSVLYALLLMLVYIAMRFDFRYAPGAVVALAHDVLITIGLFAVTWTEFNLPVVAALLTIAGYSINDTIVVYDRIRENLARLRDRKFELVVNSSINETLSRTLLTSVTTLFTCVSIWVMGAGVLKTFAFALTAGVLVGTYSSIFIASPLVVLLNERIVAAKRKAGH